MTTDWSGRWVPNCAAFRARCLAQRSQLIQAQAAPAAAQAAVFEDVLANSARSLHWRRSGFDAGVRDLASFKAAVPIRQYADFEGLIDEEVRTRGGVLSCSPVLRWLKTSGTTGVPKRIPYTLHWLSDYRVPAIEAMWGTFLAYHPEILDHPFAVLDTQTVRESVSEFLYGVEHQAISNRNPLVGATDWHPPWYEAPWFRPEADCEHGRRMYRRLRHMLGKNLHFITAINPSTILSMRDILLDRAGDLVRDVHEGTVEGKPDHAGDPELARRLERILIGNDLSLTAVWPSLRAYSSWTTSSARLYEPKMAALFPGLSRIPFMACGTEGVVTIPIDDTAQCQPLAVNQAVFEFIPADESLDAVVAAGARADTLSFDGVREAREYHLVMSQANGLHRLATGDIYRVVRMVDGLPWLEFVRRNGVYHSFTGEKLTEAQVNEAVLRALDRHGIEAGLYLCGPRWGSPPGYVLMIERPPGADLSAERLADMVDASLCAINNEYESKRETGRLTRFDVVFVPRDGISSWVERKRQRSNANQFKYKPMQSDIAFLEEVMA